MNHPREVISDSAALLELSRIINGSQDLEFILGNVLLTAMGKLMIARGCVFLRKESGRYALHSCKGMQSGSTELVFDLSLQQRRFIDLSGEPSGEDETERAFFAFCREKGLRYIVPMILHENVAGLLAMGPRLSNTPWSDADAVLLESIAAIAATAVASATLIEELRLANRRLDAKIQEQQTLYEVSREMNAAFEEESIYRLLGYALMGQMRITRYALIIEADGSYHAAIMKLQSYTENPDACRELMLLEEPRLLTENEALSDAERWIRDAGAELLIPMTSQNKILGLLCLGQRMGSVGYTASDIEYLQALASRSIVAMENARMVREILDKQRLEEQIQVARTIQRALLPRTIPDTPGYEICADNVPSQSIGGDYYDIVRLEGNRTLIAIADVSGKGIPASLLMANIQAGLRTLAPIDITLEEATTRLNKLIYENTGADKFITFFWGILDCTAHTFTYVNAGHNPPLLIHPDGAFEELDKGGILLGAMPTVPPYETGVVTFAPSDMLVLYTDGFSEAMSVQNEEFSEERMLRFLTHKPYLSAQECMDDINEEILRFTKGAEQSDDITLMTMYRK